VFRMFFRWLATHTSTHKNMKAVFVTASKTLKEQVRPITMLDNFDQGWQLRRAIIWRSRVYHSRQDVSLSLSAGCQSNAALYDS